MKTKTVVPSSSKHPIGLLNRSDLPNIDALSTIIETESVAYANENLGYKHPEKLLVRTKSELDEALRIVGIKPFDPQAVRDYQVQCILEKQGKGTETVTGMVAKVIIDNRYDWGGFDTAILVLSSISACIGLATTIAGIITGFSLAWPISLLVAGLILGYLSYKVRTQSKSWKWTRIAIKEYTSNIPAFALDTAKEIHMRAPKTSFFIEELVEVSTKRVVDPFLVAVSGDDRKHEHYLEVWEEPKFDQTRRV